jgi:hypothetical protein
MTFSPGAKDKARWLTRLPRRIKEQHGRRSQTEQVGGAIVNQKLPSTARSVCV